ncbi:MAG: GntR family transcriptional regulator [Clostridia bacterium]|nr:GntR family transcriptional regulator [Clostridia bacterium]
MTIESALNHHPGLLRLQVYEKLENDILSGRYRPDEALIEKNISKEMGVSRTPVREALRQLEQEGLVKSIPNKGVVVTRVEPQDIEDIYTIKKSIEGLAARLAAERITPEELRELEEVVDLSEFYADKNDIDRLVELDSRFHAIIFRASRNRPLMQTLQQFHVFVKRARSESLHRKGRFPQMVAEHRRIFLAIKAGNGDEAENQHKIHINNAMQSLMETMKNEN